MYWKEIKQKYYDWITVKQLKKVEKQNKKYLTYVAKSRYNAKELEEYETEDGREKVWQEQYIKTKAVITIILGTLMLAITFLLTYLCEVSEWNSKVKALCNSIITMSNSVFGILLGIGISTLVLDFFSYIKYTRNRIKEIMLEKAYIETLSSKEKRRLIEKAEHSLYFRDGEVIDNSLYANIKNLIIPLIEDNYYKQYKVHVDCYIDEMRRFIVKRSHKIMDVMCIGTENFEIPFSTYMEKIVDVKEEDLYKVIECIFNGENITKEVQEKTAPVAIEGVEVSKVKFTIDYKFKLKKGLNRIEIRTETVVPISDNTYSHTITIPCQRYSINFSLHNENYEVLGFGFAFDDESHKDDIDKIIYTNKYDDCVKIRFENWTLPGDGVVFVVNRKADSQKIKECKEKSDKKENV